jgi:hypothetical protein
MNTLNIFLIGFNLMFFIFNLSELNWVIKRRKLVEKSLNEAKDNLTKSQKHLDDICELRDEALISFGKAEMIGEFADRAGVKLSNTKNRLS